MDVVNSDLGRVIPKSSEFNRKRTKNTLPEIFRNLQHDFGGIDPSASDPSGHLSRSGFSSSSDSEDSTDFSPIKIVEKDLGLSPFSSLAPLGNDEIEEHGENAQDENEDDGPFASEALSDSEKENNPEQVPVTGRRFKETLREEKPPRVQPADGKYHLPNNFTKKEVYDHYRTDMVQVRECLQYSSETLLGQILPACYHTYHQQILAEAVEALKLHRKQQAEERAAAGRRRWKALDSPKDCAYIQIDGMDQKKTALPHFSKQPKSVDGAALVGVYLVGAMIFHGKLRPRAFLTYNNLKSDSNLTITVLQKILLEWEGILPHTLYLQLDNTVRENKNNILFAYLAMLLEKKEEIGRNISNNRRERLVGDMCWFWPVPPERDEHVVDEPVAVTTTEEFRRRIFGQRRPIYSGPRRPPPGSTAADRAAHIGELTEIHDKSFLTVLADDETSFWICQVLKINRRNEEGEPISVLIQWYATEDSNPYTGKFYPEKRRTNGKGRAALFRQEIDLEEITVLSFNFNFTTARRLRKITERHIRTGLFRIARDKEASQPEGINRLSPAIDSADDEETECSGPDLEDEEE
ncbi:hypothetical protein R1sor_008777 [Riccia sorocarpa]|uniref:DUF7869 domain-containing protein n=1 Tax=Riccia sorocarpa TaxID=122646 RepID=A0ABD3HYI2_9MARC